MYYCKLVKNAFQKKSPVVSKKTREKHSVFFFFMLKSLLTQGDGGARL